MGKTRLNEWSPEQQNLCCFLVSFLLEVRETAYISNTPKLHHSFFFIEVAQVRKTHFQIFVGLVKLGTESQTIKILSNQIKSLYSLNVDICHLEVKDNIVCPPGTSPLIKDGFSQS